MEDIDIFNLAELIVARLEEVGLVDRQLAINEVELILKDVLSDWNIVEDKPEDYWSHE